jgi:hypothetical protein
MAAGGVKRWVRDVSVAVAAGLILLWAASYFNTNPSTARPAARSWLWAALGWLWAPLAVPRVLVWLALVLVTLAGVRAWRRRLAAKPAPVVGELDDHQRDFLVALLKQHPRSVDLSWVASGLHETYAVTEILAEGLERMGLVTVISGLYHAKSLFLTQRGRDICVERGLNLLV